MKIEILFFFFPKPSAVKEKNFCVIYLTEIWDAWLFRYLAFMEKIIFKKYILLILGQFHICRQHILITFTFPLTSLITPRITSSSLCPPFFFNNTPMPICSAYIFLSVGLSTNIWSTYQRLTYPQGKTDSLPQNP